MTMYHSRTEAKRHREFPMLPITGEDGRLLKGYRITCIECGATEQRLRTNAFPDDLFRKIGWAVGNNEKHDRCPACIKGKVVHMADHKKAEPTAALGGSTPMSREEARILSRTIEDHWDEAGGCYQMGWSDTKLAEANGVAVEWVKAIRERDFGGTGDDPTAALFIAQQVEVKREVAMLKTALEMTTQKLEESTMWMTELARKTEGYRNTARRLVDRVEGLEKIAERMTLEVPPRKAG